MSGYVDAHHHIWPHRELPWLAGYEDSQPVRVGNGAADLLWSLARAWLAPGRRALIVEPTPEGRSRLVSRWRQDWPKSIGTFIWSLISDPGAFVMEQKMLRTIRTLAERRAGRVPMPTDTVGRSTSTRSG